MQLTAVNQQSRERHQSFYPLLNNFHNYTNLPINKQTNKQKSQLTPYLIKYK